MKRITFILSAILVFGVFSFSSAHAIKKCQDTDGNWHYGDIAVAQCSKSKVTTLNDRGFISSEKDAPKTLEQVQKEADEKAKAVAEAERVQAEEDERIRILSVYETEADIDRQRDNQIDSVNGNVAVHKAYVKSVTSKIQRLKKKGADFTGGRKKLNLEQIAEAQARVDTSNAELIKLEEQKTSIVHRFAEEKKIYLELKNRS
ncbi:MAG: hypothetical protein JKX81_19455 [Arenicella sp.]|nr:hypothetical protein [Arenicella sp.]